MASKIDHDQLFRDVARRLAAGSPRASTELARELGISQATFSRVAAGHASELLVLGRARSTRYALRRSIPDVGHTLPIFEVDERGGARHLGRLHALARTRFYVEAIHPDLESRFHDDLPYFLDGMRPAGFLGRLVPQVHAELELPGDVRHWSADQTLRYLSHFGSDLPGSLIVGDAAFKRHLETLRSPPPAIAPSRRAVKYEALAEDVLGGAPPGSSVGGERPKFLSRRLPGPTDVLVKFSPPLEDAPSTRIADLLVAEHLALRTLAAHGEAAASSELVEGRRRIFLEVQRFDRMPDGGRRGVVSLLALDAEFLGRMKRWSESAEALADAGHVGRAAVARLRWLECFGRLIANTDMHFGNASFFTQGTTVVPLAPAYDMSPTFYAPRSGDMGSRAFVPPPPEPDVAPVWTAVCDAASEFWGEVGSHGLVSAPFRRIALANRSAIARIRDEGRRLPR